MRFTMNRTLQAYYIFALVAGVSLFSYGAVFYWKQGPLNGDYVSALYEGTSLVDGVKKRNDVDELKKYIDGDRLKDAKNVIERFDGDLKELQKIKPIVEKSKLSENYMKVKNEVSALQSHPELSTILTNVTGKIAQFENFVIEKKWPTLSKMATNLRIKTSPSKIMSGGLYSFEKTSNLINSINNDLEAMSNFTQSTGLPLDIKTAILNRIQVLRNEAASLNTYQEEHARFNKVFNAFYNDYKEWFKLVEPEIALRKLEFEKNSQTIMFAITLFVLGGLASIGLGIWIYFESARKIAKKIEKNTLNLIGQSLLPVDGALKEVYSTEFVNDFERFRDFVHKRMTFGSIFQEAMPFPSILLDSNLNLIWGNSHFYKEWQLDNVDEKSETLTWDFIKRFTNMEDQSALLNALRMNHAGIIPIQVKSRTSENGGSPFEMHISPVEHAGQKRIMLIFYPLMAIEENLKVQRDAIVEPTVAAINAIKAEEFTLELQGRLAHELDFAGTSEIFQALKDMHDYKTNEKIELQEEIARLDDIATKTLNTMSSLRKNLVASIESHRFSSDKFNALKNSFGILLDSRDSSEEQMRVLFQSVKELMKDQIKMLATAEASEKMVDDYIKSVKYISSVKANFKGIKDDVDGFRMRMIQLLDQLLIFQSHDGDNQKMEQFLGKMKFEIKAFDRVLHQLTEASTQMDVQLTKIELMNENRVRLDLEGMKARFDQAKTGFENIQFSASKTSQVSHLKDEEMIDTLKALVSAEKTQMRRTDELCLQSGMTAEHLKVITDSSL